MPIYEYKCKNCNSEFERLEKISSESWETLKKKLFSCNNCGTYSACRKISLFKIGTKVLETTGKSGYETEDLTLGKIIDEGGIPAEEKRKLRERDKMIERQQKYTRALNKRAKKYNFNPLSDE